MVQLIVTNASADSLYLRELEKRTANGNFACNEVEAVKKYSCLIYQAAKGIEEDVTSPKFKVYYAIEAMNITQNIVSSGRYSFISRKLKGDFNKPGTNASVCLDLGYGICGNHASVFIALLNEVGIRSRAVQFFYNTNDGKRHSHIAAEAYIQGEWNYFDSTWGGFFVNEENDLFKVASVQNIISKPDKYKLIDNAAQTWRLMTKYAGLDVYEHLKLNPSIVYGYDNGTIRIDHLLQTDDKLNLQHVPAYVGDNKNDGAFEGIRYKFSPLEGKYAFHFNISGIGGCANKSKICVNENCVSINKIKRSKPIRIDIVALNPSGIHISSKDSVCYVVFKEIGISKLR